MGVTFLHQKSAGNLKYNIFYDRQTLKAKENKTFAWLHSAFPLSTENLAFFASLKS